MQENEFEKKMQEKMGAFQLQPTGTVWENIQSQVAKGKERKRKYIIFFILLLSFLTSTLWVADLKRPAVVLNKQEDKKNESLQQVSERNNVQLQQQSKENYQPAISPAGNNTANNIKQQETVVVENENRTRHGKIKRSTKGNVKMKITPAVIAEDDIVVDNKMPVEQQPMEKDLVIASGVKEKIEENEPKENLAKEQLQKEPVKENNTGTKAVQQIVSTTKNKKWGIGFILSAGRSSTGNGLGAKNTAFDYNNNGSSGVGSTPNQSTTYSPSAPKPYFAATAGFNISRSLSTNTSLAIGLQYKLLTTSIATGDRISAVAFGTRAVYSAGIGNSYISFYHFIALPVSFSAKVAAIKNKAINLDAAVNFSRLIHTNALQFDYTQGNYYRDNTVFNKTLVGLSAAISINLAGQNKAPFYIGPYFYYGLTPQASSGMYVQTHYKSFGIRIQKFLLKK